MAPIDDSYPKGPIPGLTRDDDAVIPGDTPDEALPDEDEDDVLAPFDAEDGMLGVADDDTIGVDKDDDHERGAP